MNDSIKQQNQAEVPTSAFAIVGLAVAAAVAAGYFTGNESGNDIAYKIGFFLFPALLGWGLVYATCLRGVRASFKAGAFGMIYFALITGSFVGESQETVQLAANKSAFDDTLSEAMELNLEASRTGERLDYTPGPSQASGEMGALDTFIKNEFAAQFQLRNEYISGLDALGFEEILDPSALSSDRGLSEAQYILRRVDALLDDYQQAFYAHVEAMPQRVDDLDLPPSSKREFKAGLRQGMARAREHQSRVFELERKILQALTDMVDSLHETQGDWEVVDGQFLFAEDWQAEQFNRYYEKVAAFHQQQMQTIESQQNNAIERFNSEWDSPG